MAKKKILVVEDEKAFLDVLKGELEREGFEVFEAKNGEEGLKAAVVSRPDLILLDILMPVMDGVEMLKKLREDEWGRNAKVITLTNLNDSEMVSKVLEQGSYEYFVKSDWSVEDLIKRVKEILK